MCMIPYAQTVFLQYFLICVTHTKGRHSYNYSHYTHFLVLFNLVSFYFTKSLLYTTRKMYVFIVSFGVLHDTRNSITRKGTTSQGMIKPRTRVWCISAYTLYVCAMQHTKSYCNLERMVSIIQSVGMYGTFPMGYSTCIVRLSAKNFRICLCKFVK